MTGKGAHFLLVAASQNKIDVFRAWSSGMIKCDPTIIQVFLDHGPNAYHPLGMFIKSLDSVYISESESVILSQVNKVESASAIEKLMICGVDFLQNRQQKDGFNIWKKNVAKKFQTGVRVATAVIAYCHHQNKQLKKDELEYLLDAPEKHEGADALIKYKGKVPRDLIQDIYTELPQEYRHARGEKTK